MIFQAERHERVDFVENSQLTPADILGPRGRWGRRLDHYEPRPQQLAMSDAVGAAIQQGGHLIVEAGTGVGKTFAYLVPAIIAAAGPRDDGTPAPRVVLS